MDNTLAYIILPMLKQLKERKHGSQFIDDEDLPVHMRHGDALGEDNWVHYKWEWVLNEMIWSFEQVLDDVDWETQFYHGDPEYVKEEVEHPEYGTCYTLKQTNQIGRAHV